MTHEKFPTIDLEPRNAFLALFEPHLRSVLMEVFLNCGPRSGIVMPPDIMGAVVYHLRSWVDVHRETEDRSCWREVLLSIAENWDLAEAFADYCVRYSALPECFQRPLQLIEKPDGGQGAPYVFETIVDPPGGAADRIAAA